MPTIKLIGISAGTKTRGNSITTKNWTDQSQASLIFDIRKLLLHKHKVQCDRDECQAENFSKSDQD